MRPTQGLARRDAIVLAAVVLALGATCFGLLPCVTRCREEARRIRCRNNLNQMAKGIATYIGQLGNNRWYPWPLGSGTRPDDFNGAEWLASLYWTGVMPDPSVFLCPSTDDTNRNGFDLGTHRAAPGRFGSQTVSYAGLHYRSFTDTDGNPTADWSVAANVPMACDDTQGPPHHPPPSGMSVLFLDSHVEFKTPTELEIEGWGPNRLPWPLRN